MGSPLLKLFKKRSPEEKAPRRPPSRLAKISLMLLIIAVISLVIFGLMISVDPNGPGLIFILLFSGFCFPFLGSFFFGVLAFIQKLFALVRRKESRPIWPASISVILFLAFFSGPILSPYLKWRTKYFKTGMPYETYEKINHTRESQRSVAYDLEERYRAKGQYLPWCPLGRQKQMDYNNQKNYDIDKVPRELLALPTFSILQADIKDYRNFADSEYYHPGCYKDPFMSDLRLPFGYFSINADKKTSASGYILWSCGPDQKYDLNAANIETAYNPAQKVPSDYLVQRIYDPSNGALSPGDIVRYKN